MKKRIQVETAKGTMRFEAAAHETPGNCEGEAHASLSRYSDEWTTKNVLRGGYFPTMDEANEAAAKLYDMAKAQFVGMEITES